MTHPLHRETLPGGHKFADLKRERFFVLTILYHPRIERIGSKALLEAEGSGEVAEISRLHPLFAAPSAAESVEARKTGKPSGPSPLSPPFMPVNGTDAEPLADLHISRKPIRIGSASETHLFVEPAVGGGDLMVAGRPVTGRCEISIADCESGVVLMLSSRVVLLLRYTEYGETFRNGQGLLGVSNEMQSVRDAICRVADLDVPVLITGETGSGKELVAQAIHRVSKRQKGKLVSVNAAAISGSVAASELFGHRKGAFTGAVRDHIGYFEQAEGSTLFLDEIGDVSSDIQAMLLRVLETLEIQPVGSPTHKKVDVRLIAATDRDLESAIEKGMFRQPLLHRLAGYEIQLPPLRARREDIGLLFMHFIRLELETLGEERLLENSPWIPAPIIEQFCRYDWPGNIRELRNIARQLVISNRGKQEVRIDAKIRRLFSSPLPSLPSPQLSVLSEDTTQGELPKKKRKPADVSEEELIEALRANIWQTGHTATYLNISKTSLYKLIDSSSRIRKAKSLTAEEIRPMIQSHQRNVQGMAAILEVSPRGLKLRMRELGLV